MDNDDNEEAKLPVPAISDAFESTEHEVNGLKVKISDGVVEITGKDKLNKLTIDGKEIKL